MKKIYPTLLCLFALTRLSAQTCDVLCNGNFDNPFITATNGLVTTISCWSTTASDGQMEVWGTGFAGVPSYSGSEFVELNATQPATMYQDFSATNGVPLSISFAHRGRAGTDTVQVSIGPSGGPFTSLGTWGDGTSAWGYYTTSYTPTSTAVYRIRFTPVYWSGGNIAIGNFLDAVSVNTSLSMTVVPSATSICVGNTVTLTASGATNYTWTAGPTNSVNVVSPVASSVYTVTGIDILSGCSGTKIIQVVVNQLPVIVITPTVRTICQGKAASFSASGALTYTWSPGNVISNVFTASPLATSFYTVNATDANNCSNAAVVQVKVNNCVGLVEYKGESGLIQVSPNPSLGIINAKFEFTGRKQIQITDGIGQVIQTRVSENQSEEFDLTQYAKGIYYVKIASGANVANFRISVQ